METVDVVQMSEYLKIPEVAVRAGLGEKVEVANFSEALAVYSILPDDWILDKDSAFRNCLKFIETFEEAFRLAEITIKNTNDFGTVFPKVLNLVSYIGQARRAFELAPDGTLEKIKALKVLSRFYPKRIPNQNDLQKTSTWQKLLNTLQHYARGKYGRT